jgi:hypothetical protein
MCLSHQATMPGSQGPHGGVASVFFFFFLFLINSWVLSQVLSIQPTLASNS